ncbi:DUF4136 domain-containing protein [Tenacibaculum caenipelagi]|uniref:Uncharacterized protein DUF4136 n=1 Tax=Tenacibaculum caenipelagi TaxID=1325435 RepID=A0A4R6TKM0_9FLAO|nr:DUF4136 domain-containing protein [Tenacibaculum caenipelagi]TDQ30067.1 uncharacterized protein DUF4136 [Tenacibaculum caenipelagi]
MKYYKYLFLLVFIGCSSSKIVYDYDSQANFSSYKTFNFFEDAGKGLNELDVKRVTNELTTSLEAKGMRLAENPDIYINILSSERPSINRNTIGLGIGSGGRNVGFGISGGIPIESRKINQQLTVDFVESKNNQLIWQGVANSEIKEKTSPEERRIYYQKLIKKMVSNYPPK